MAKIGNKSFTVYSLFRMFEEISHSQIRPLREKLIKEQHGCCAICGTPLSGEDKVCLDHQHLFKSEPLGRHNGGMIRGVLCNNCNALEGKIWNNLYRYGKAKKDNHPVEARIEWLEQLISYYRDNFSHKQKILHPSEKRVEPLKKSQYNAIYRAFKADSKNFRNGRLKKFPPFTGRWNKTLKQLAESYRIID